MSTVNKLKEERLNQGLTQSRLAKRAGVTMRTIHNAEAGRRLRRDTQRRILEALGHSYGDAPLFFKEAIR